MAEIRPVVPPSRSRDRGLRTAVTGLAILLAVAVVKPWGSTSEPQQAVITPSPYAPRTRSTATPEPSRGRAYDPDLFGQRPPAPAWELWPAGYVVHFGFAGPLSVEGPVASSPASPDPRLGGISMLDLGLAEHLDLLGLNAPLGVSVTNVALWQLPAGRPARRIDLRRFPSPWRHPTFRVYGLPGAAVDEFGEWAPGFYRLDIVTDRGPDPHSIAFMLGPLPRSSTFPSPAPGGSSGPNTPTGTPAAVPVGPGGN
jgi:hypothetical protein